MKCNKCECEIPEDSVFCPNCGDNIKAAEGRTIPKISFRISLKGILVVIALGIWMLVLQNFGVFSSTQEVKVANAVEVYGSVDVSGAVDINNLY